MTGYCRFSRDMAMKSTNPFDVTKKVEKIDISREYVDSINALR